MSERHSKARPFECGFFMHPLPLFTVGLLILNDHYLKVHFHNAMTGKLSDFSGLFFFPLFLCALWTILGGRFSTKALLWSIFATDVVFSSIKTSTVAASLYVHVLQLFGVSATVVLDKTDLWALLSSLAVYLFARRYLRLLIDNHDGAYEGAIV